MSKIVILFIGWGACLFLPEDLIIQFLMIWMAFFCMSTFGYLRHGKMPSRHPDFDTIVRRRFLEGKSSRQIARELCVSSTEIEGYLARHGYLVKNTPTNIFQHLAEVNRNGSGLRPQ